MGRRVEGELKAIPSRLLAAWTTLRDVIRVIGCVSGDAGPPLEGTGPGGAGSDIGGSRECREGEGRSGGARM